MTQRGSIEDIRIPELETIAEVYEPIGRPWNAHDKAVVKTYYGRVPTTKLIEFLDHPRTVNAVEKMAKKIREEGEETG